MSSSGKRSSEEEDVMARLSKCTPKVCWLPIYVRVSQLLVRILDAELSGADLFKTSEVWRKSSALGFGVQSRGDCRAEIQRCAWTGADRHREEGREGRSKVGAREADGNLFVFLLFLSPRAGMRLNNQYVILPVTSAPASH